MESYYVIVNGTQSGPFDSEAIIDRIREDSLQVSDLCWCKGMENWLPIEEAFPQFIIDPLKGARHPLSEPQALNPIEGNSPPNEQARGVDHTDIDSSLAHPEYYSFIKNPQPLTSLLITMLWISLGIEVLSILSDLGQIAVLDGPFSESEAAANDARQGVVGFIYLGGFLVTGIIFLKWIYRANINCRGFGAKDMNFTPGWSIGYYFVPFLNLVRPFQSMKEIWQVSGNPRDWPSEKGNRLLTTWWALWLAAGFLGQATFRTSMSADSVEALREATLLSVFSSIIGIGLCLAAVKLVKQLVQRQQQLVGRIQALDIPTN